MISTLTNTSLALLLRIVLGILWRLQTCQRHRGSSSSVFPGFSHSLAYAPKHSKCPQGISKCLFSWAFLYPDVVLSHIRTEGQTAGQQAQTFLFFQICQKQQFNMSQKCIRSWKMYLQSLTIIDFPTLCANQMCAKKWVEESFIINLWKQRLVLAFFFAFFFPVGDVICWCRPIFVLR